MQGGEGVKKGQKLRAHYMDGPLTGLVLSIYTKVVRSMLLQKDMIGSQFTRNKKMNNNKCVCLGPWCSHSTSLG